MNTCQEWDVSRMLFPNSDPQMSDLATRSVHFDQVHSGVRSEQPDRRRTEQECCPMP